MLAQKKRRYSITLNGHVQGVGMRPLVWRLANEQQLAGYVRNVGSSVEIDVWTEEGSAQYFLSTLLAQAPIASSIDTSGLVLKAEVEGTPAPRDFSVLESESSTGTVFDMPDDRGICEACVREVLDPANRRYQYLFNHCVDCGPRYSIIKSLPFDREHTSMLEFAMCAKCQSEYQNPASRRFHAQINSCHDCGPQYSLYPPIAGHNDLIGECAHRLKSGQIVAYKATGGYRLMCLASNNNAVKSLRAKKNRPDKPLALMFQNIQSLEGVVECNAYERELLSSPANPIVLLKTINAGMISARVAPEQNRLGVMLPGNAFEVLLLQAMGEALVMTSANVQGEPQIYDDSEAQSKLSSIADSFVTHDRIIQRRLDDSVVLGSLKCPQVLRRARGFSCARIQWPAGFSAEEPLLAFGADLKNTIAIGSRTHIQLSEHYGDLTNLAATEGFQLFVHRFCREFGARIKRVVTDKHPHYFSRESAQRFSSEHACNLAEVQHHHAHAASVMLEHGLPLDARVIAVVFDGLGMGDDGTLWGGEFFIGGYQTMQRAAHVQPVPLPGGDKASKQPWRNLFAHLYVAKLVDDAGFARVFEDRMTPDQARAVRQMLDKGVQCPPASSVGRLFDAFAALIGACFQNVSYEGQAAQTLESIAEPIFPSIHERYSIALRANDDMDIWHWSELWREALSDLQCGVSKPVMAAKFHRTLIECVVRQVSKLGARSGIKSLVLSGGVMQNRLLSSAIADSLQPRGFNVLSAHKLPAHDGGLAAGQLAVAVAQRCDCESVSAR